MTRKLVAGAALSGLLILGTGAAAQAANGAYPPAPPTTPKTTAPPQVAPETNNKNNPTVLNETNTTNTSTLPKTGSDWMGTAALGAGLLAGGTGLVVASRRRQTD